MYFRDIVLNEDVLLEENIFKKIGNKIQQMRDKRFNKKSVDYTRVTREEFDKVIETERELAKTFCDKAKEFNATYKASPRGIFGKSKLYDPESKKAIDSIDVGYTIILNLNVKAIDKYINTPKTYIDSKGNTQVKMDTKKNVDTEVSYERRKMWREEILPKVKEIYEELGISFSKNYKYGDVEFIAIDRSSGLNICFVCTDIDEFEDGYMDKIYISVYPENHYVLKASEKSNKD